MWKLFSLMLCVLVSLHVRAQSLPPNQPEQDACNALQLCGISFHTPYTYQGNGQISDLINTPCGVPGLPAGEDNVVWLQLNISSSGVLLFDIEPLNPADDYDWALVDITNTNCNSFGPQHVVRCNFNQNQPITAGGHTGLTLSATETNVAAGTPGHNFCQYVDAQAGEVYLLMINNFGVGGGPTSGFTVNFQGSTATFNNDGAPELNGYIGSCNTANSVIITLSEPVACSSIAVNGSDFSMSGGTISNAIGINCSGGQGYTDQILLNFNPALAPGSYTINAQIGDDGNTLLDLCNNPLVLPDAFTFSVPTLSTTESFTICSNQLPYTWNGQVVNQGGNDVAQATFPNQLGCDSVVHLNLTVVDTIKHTETITICPEQLPYTWNGQQVSTPGNNAANYYTLSTAGCDSLTTLHLIVQYPTSQSYDLSGCGEVVFNGQSYTQSQTVLDTVISSFGCDSVYATLNIVVHPVNPVLMSIDTSACDELLYEGTNYTESTVLFDTLLNQYGCDSIYEVTNIFIYPNQYDLHEYTVAACDIVSFEGRTYTYDTVLIDTFQQSTLGCDSAIRTVVIHPEHFELSLTASPEEPVEGVHVVLSTTANVPDYHLLAWYPEELFPNQLSYEQHFLASQTNTYTVVGQSALGCVDSATLTVRVDSLVPVVVMPNAFSPNGDGLNDVFEPKFVNKNGYEVNVFRIFNRYGQVVFSRSGLAMAGWDGTYDRSGEPAEDGVYYYYIEVQFVNGEKQFYKGDVTLIH